MDNKNIENQIDQGLKSIFSEIENIKFLVYENIKNRHLDTTSDITDAIVDTGFNKILNNFKINGRQYDVDRDRILKFIDSYIYYDIIDLVSKEQWEWE